MLHVASEGGETRTPELGARRLAAVAFVDVVGYSVLMATDGRWPYVQSDSLGPGMYYVEHPINGLHQGGGGAPRKREPLVQICPVHHVALSSTGRCDDCS